MRPFGSGASGAGKSCCPRSIDFFTTAVTLLHAAVGFCFGMLIGSIVRVLRATSYR